MFREWRNGVNTDKLVQSITTYKDTANYYKTKSGAEVSSNVSLKLQSEAQLRQMASLNDTVKQIIAKFKDLKAVTFITNKFFAGNDTIKMVNNIPCDFKPFKVRRGDSTYKFAGTIAPNYFSIDSIFVPNKLTIVQGRKKVSFLKWDYAMDVTNSNPLMRTTNIADYRYIPQKKWFEKTWFHLVVGASLEFVGQRVGNSLIKRYFP